TRPNQGKRVLAVRAMAASVAWLGGRPRWHEGRVVWESAHGVMDPGPAELALAQRRLYQIARYPAAASQALGDSRAWLAGRQAALDMAKMVRGLTGDAALDLEALAAGAAAGDHRAAGQLAGLVVVEALCASDLPASPVASL